MAAQIQRAPLAGSRLMVTAEALDLIQQLALVTDVLNQLADHEIALGKDAADRADFNAAFTHVGRADGLAEASSVVARHLTRWLSQKREAA